MHWQVCCPACPKLVACLAIILLVTCIMLAMDNMYLETFSASQRPVFFIQPLGVIEYTTTVHSVSSVSKVNQPVSTANPSAGDLYILNNFGGNINVSLLKGISSFFYKFVFYTFIFYNFIFYSFIFYTLFFIHSFFIRSFFIRFIFYTVHFL